MKKVLIVLAISFGLFSGCKKTGSEIPAEEEKDISSKVAGTYTNPVNAPIPNNEYDYRETRWIIEEESEAVVSVHERIVTMRWKDNVQLVDSVKTHFQNVMVSPGEDGGKFTLTFDKSHIANSDSTISKGSAHLSGNLLESSIILKYNGNEFPPHQVRIFKQEDN